MKLPFSDPDPAGTERARKAKKIRDLATEVSRLQPQALTRNNGEEGDYSDKFPANFTKGLLHDEWGLLFKAGDYRCLVEAINSPDRTLFEKHIVSANSYIEREEYEYSCKRKNPKPKNCPSCLDEVQKDPLQFSWRSWESPRAGHVYELEGPDAGAVGMAPAPRVGSSELSAEMAEVYGLAILRDVPFTEICKGGGKQLCGDKSNDTSSILSADKIVHLLNDMPFYSGKNRCSSTQCNIDGTGLNHFERNRRYARTLSDDGKLTSENIFRGSTKGAQTGPYLSQFMLIGTQSIAGEGGGASSFPGKDACFDLKDGFITYGTLVIDQRTITHKNCLDYMTNWSSWLDVQNGANLKGLDKYEEKRRFITTPRDLATYVHFDALYEAYLNAALILLSMGAKHSKGFPEPSASGNRDAFATFGGPHILSLVTEVATRCLKAVRRQKFNYHRRARPETLSGRFTLACLGEGKEIGCGQAAFEKSLNELPDELLKAIAKHNKLQNTMDGMRGFTCDKVEPKGVNANKFSKCNLLLPMAFPEGSPMHPAYGAGHATVAGGCVTMLKAFFEMFEDNDSNKERELLDSSCDPIIFVPNDDGSRLIKDKKHKKALTIQGELDKLAANIAIGRNMAGVHYYSDYFDSLRMGERITVGILMEQSPTYGDYMETTFKSFDGDYITISGEANSCPSLSIIDCDGNPVKPKDWWLRHTSGEEFSEDL